MSNGFTIFAGPANPALAAATVRELGVQVSAHTKLEHPTVRQVFVTDTVCVAEKRRKGRHGTTTLS